MARWSSVLTASLGSLSHKLPGLTNHSTGPVMQYKTCRKTKRTVMWILLVSTGYTTERTGMNREGLLFTGSIALAAAEGDADHAAREGHI